MDGVHGEGWEADGYVFGTGFVWSRVADPFAGAGDYRLSGGDVDGTVLMFDMESTFQDYRKLVEGGSLAGLLPSGGAAHVGDAGGGGFGVDASDVLVN